MTTKDVDPRNPLQEGLDTESPSTRTSETEVPSVTADVDETPRFVRYGAAVLLGLAFGVGCYVWFGNGIPSAPQQAGRSLNLPSAGSLAALHITPDSKTIPAPFAMLGSDWTTMPQKYSGQDYAAPATQYAETAGEPAAVYLFSYDSSKVPDNPELNALAAKAGKEGLRINVRAYTDEHGRLVYNQRLSERRAKAIGDYLATHGVSSSKITTKGMGPTHKYSDDAHDRRAEVRLIR